MRLLTFEQFLHDTAEKGRTINTLFEERLFALVGTLQRIAAPLAAAQIPYEVIGGMAVMVQVDRVEPSAVRNTKDIDIMIHRADLERIKAVSQRPRVHVSSSGVQWGEDQGKSGRTQSAAETGARFRSRN
jgi:hypothetical protein